MLVLTVLREMFEEKKNANAYNYSQEFPPTLRDLVSRYTTLIHDRTTPHNTTKC